ncbi:hypothetical protein N9X61_04490 [Sulfurimonas sp.]|nr:hypothetical protein [Sulfurimonas sp.]
MKLWNLTTFLTVSILTFSGCVDKSPKPKAVVDSTLATITLTKNGTFTDMKAVGFEWNSIKDDPRIEGVYVYKKVVDSKEKLNAFYDTLNNRFITHYLDENVKPNTEYSYVFKTFTKEAESVPSREILVKTLPILNSVTWIHVVQEMPRSAKIIWRPHTNQIVENYIIERKTLADDKWKDLALVKGRLNAEYIDMDLKDSHVYKYRIRAVTYNDITSKPSKEVKVLTKALPISIDNIIASSDLPRKINLTWEQTKIPDFLHYRIYRASSLDGSYREIMRTKSIEFIDNIDEDGKDYFYRVSVIDKDHLESRHDLKSVHGKTLSKPLAPSLVAVKMLGNNLEIQWKSTSQRVKSYIVEKTIKKSWIDSQTEEFVDIKGKNFVDTKVEPKTTYYYKVYSVDAFSIKSEPSMEVKFETKKNQGKVIQREIPKVIQKEQNVIKPMDDFDVSNL